LYNLQFNEKKLVADCTIRNNEGAGKYITDYTIRNYKYFLMNCGYKYFISDLQIVHSAIY